MALVWAPLHFSAPRQKPSASSDGPRAGLKDRPMHVYIPRRNVKAKRDLPQRPIHTRLLSVLRFLRAIAGAPPACGEGEKEGGGEGRLRGSVALCVEDSLRTTHQRTAGGPKP
eukprot:1187121-Prorocentrum_minimum.AAC.2